LYTLPIVTLSLPLLGALPTWRHSAGRGYEPSGGLGLALMILIIPLLIGRGCRIA
jgi:hypothetical protein